jgi:hypothetical protein
VATGLSKVWSPEFFKECSKILIVPLGIPEELLRGIPTGISGAYCRKLLISHLGFMNLH